MQCLFMDTLNLCVWAVYNGECVYCREILLPDLVPIYGHPELMCFWPLRIMSMFEGHILLADCPFMDSLNSYLWLFRMAKCETNREILLADSVPSYGHTKLVCIFFAV